MIQLYLRGWLLGIWQWYSEYMENTSGTWYIVLFIIVYFFRWCDPGEWLDQGRLERDYYKGALCEICPKLIIILCWKVKIISWKNKRKTQNNEKLEKISNLQRLSWVHLLLTIYKLSWSFSLRGVCFPSDSNGRNKILICQMLSIGDSFLVMAGNHIFISSFTFRTPTGAITFRPCAASVSVILYVHQSCWFSGSCFHCFLHPTCQLYSFCLFFIRVP